MNTPSRPLTILRLLLSVSPYSAPYNQFSLALSNKHKITICCYFRSGVLPPREIELVEGDGTLRGFYKILRDVLNQRVYDVIHAHTPHVGFLFLLGAALRRPGLLSSTIYTVHNSYPRYEFRHKLMLIPVFAGFHTIVFCSNSSYHSFPDSYRWLARNKLRIVQNGVDINRIDHVVTRNPRQSDSAGFVLASVSRLTKVKNPGSILRAFHQSNDERSSLLFVGDGDLACSLAEKSKDLKIEKYVKIAGTLPREQVYQQLARADLFVSASKVEGLPVSVLEAMACRCPVLLSDIPPHREIAAGTDFIPLVDPDDVAGFARQIRRFQGMSPVERAEIGTQCRQLVEDRFSLTAMHQGYEEIYAEILANG